MTALSHALECAAAHGWGVFPASQHKAPNTPQRPQSCQYWDPERIRAMWGQYGGLLIGIRTGQASNLAVLETAPRQHNGANWWRKINRYRLPATRARPHPQRRATPVLQACTGLALSTARIAPGIQREGGRWRDYLLALPSFNLSFNTTYSTQSLVSNNYKVLISLLKSPMTEDQEMEVEEHFSS